MAVTAIVNKNTLSKYIVSGIIAGLGGGIVFGILMVMMNSLPMVGALIGQPNAMVGFIVHLVISATIGMIYGVTISLSHIRLNWSFGVISGIVNGVIWWVLGGLIFMPLGLGMTEMVLKVGADQWISLMGHIIYGIVAGLLFVPLINRK